MTIDTKRLRELAEAALPDAARTIHALHTCVDFYVSTFYERKDGADAHLNQDGPVAKMLAMLTAANPQTVIALIDLIESHEHTAALRAKSHEEIRADRDALRAEVERLRAVATDIEMQRHATAKARDQALAALDYLAFWKGRDQHHANAEEIAAGNMIIGEDGEAEPRGAK